MQEEIRKHIAKFLSVDVNKVQDATTLKDLVTDSFILIDLVIDLQNTFKVQLVQDDLATVNVVSDLIQVLIKKAK